MSEVTSVVIQLQKEALDPNIPVSELLRKVKAVSSKLNLSDILRWVDNELNGYTKETASEVPDYRYIDGHLKAMNPYRGWQPVYFEDPEAERTVSHRSVGSKIAALEVIAKSDDKAFISLGMTPEAKASLMKGIDYCTDVCLKIERNEIVGILDATRNKILDWSLSLERQGILGEGLAFSSSEKAKAAESVFHINIGPKANFVGNFGMISEGGSVSVNQGGIDFSGGLKEFLGQVQRYAPDLGLDTAASDKLNSEIGSLLEESKSVRPDEKKIRNHLITLKGIIEGVTSGLISQGILTTIQALLTQIKI